MFSRFATSAVFRTARGFQSISKPAVKVGIVFTASVGTAVFLNSSEAAANKNIDISAVKKDIIKLIEADNDFRDDGTSVAPTLVRLAWHASGTYSKVDKTGGSNGSTMRYPPESEWGANAGLYIAR